MFLVGIEFAMQAAATKWAAINPPALGGTAGSRTASNLCVMEGIAIKLMLLRQVAKEGIV